MALNLPKISRMTPGESARLKPMQVPGYKAPKKPQTFNIGAPGKKVGGGGGGGKQQTHSPYDQFMLDTPYDPTTIGSIAQTGYDTDLANATRLAGMGYLTNDQLNAQAANRATQVQGVAASLRDQLAGIQQASVAQSNAGGAMLAQQNAAAAAGGPRIPGAPPVEGIPTGAATAVLASQGAGTGNYYGTLQAAAASSGAQNAQKAYDAGTTAIQSNDANKQKTLASLLAGIDPVSARTADMTVANQKVSAANIQTKLSVYDNLVNQSQFAATTGNKLAMSQADNALKRYEDQLSSADKRLMNIQDNQTSTANNLRTTTTSTANSQRTAATRERDRRAKAWQAKQDREAKVKAAKVKANATLQTANAKAVTSSPTTTVKGAADPTTGKAYRGYTVGGVMVPVTKAGPKDLLGKSTTVTTMTRKPKKFTANQWNAFVKSGPAGHRRLAILGLPEGSKVDVTTARGY